MDARQVILSACNTGSWNDTYLTVGFSGLTRAFLFAGAHAVLASHWAIDSLTAVRLTNGMFTGGDGERGTATALQKAMLSIARGPETQLRHPAFWAPFVLVGN
jgi:CHAT domain-containing protein